MAGPKQRERPDETHGAVPQIQPQAQPNVFQQPQSQGVSNPMFKFGIADGVVDIMRGAAITMDVNGPITLEKARQHEDRLDGWMRERQGGEWAYETRVTSGNMHVA
ncbi:MAG TPA: hypothetical protein VLD37_04375, partial [Candidatus Bilamarchaeum sp.]|nr:hypothetical protein [Candidatus Bilamarchaeum sp.]